MKDEIKKLIVEINGLLALLNEKIDKLETEDRGGDTPPPPPNP